MIPRQPIHVLTYAANLQKVHITTLENCIKRGLLTSAGLTWQGKPGYAPADVKAALKARKDLMEKEAKAPKRAPKAERSDPVRSWKDKRFCDGCGRWRPLDQMYPSGRCAECNSNRVRLAASRAANQPKF